VGSDEAKNRKNRRSDVTTNAHRPCHSALHWRRRQHAVDRRTFKGPIVHRRVSRAPYFYDGAPEELERVVEFHDRQFRIGLVPQDTADLVALLRVL
jgi:hypothetical protein